MRNPALRLSPAAHLPPKSCHFQPYYYPSPRTCLPASHLSYWIFANNQIGDNGLSKTPFHLLPTSSRNIWKAAKRLAKSNPLVTRSHCLRLPLRHQQGLDTQTLAEKPHHQCSEVATCTCPDQTTRFLAFECASAAPACHQGLQAHCPTLRARLRCRSSRAALAQEHSRGAS